MNVEKTVEFILDMQAKTEARFAKADERFAKAEERADRADRRMDRLEASLGQTILVEWSMGPAEMACGERALAGENRPEPGRNQ